MKVLLLCSLLCGCATAEFAPASLRTHVDSRTKLENIDIFPGQRPNRKFLEVGVATACCSKDPNRLIALLRKKAFENGGDALIDLEFTSAGQVAATVIHFEETPDAR